MPPLEERVFAALRERGASTVRELVARLGASQPSLSRALTALGTRVVRIGRARRSRYAALRDVRGLGSRFPLFRIDRDGRPQHFGELSALAGDGCLVDAPHALAWLRGSFEDGLFPGLPWFLDDLRPQGFLGRQFAHRFARELGLPDDLARWGDDAVLAALLLRGDDAPGDFVLGEAALDVALRAAPMPMPEASRASRYAALATAALAGESIGSSAAGEQPKFTACVADRAGRVRHVIVKFSEPVRTHASARRWADLLRCEHLAAVLLAEHGHASASTELIESGGRCCLESTRFDRSGQHGRRGFVTLAAWSDAHVGERDDWPTAARRMLAVGVIDAATLLQIEQRWWFGRLIGNTDMHFGNLGFFLDDRLPLALAPAYDMLPMLYRPAGNGAIVAREFDPPPPLPATLEAWRVAAGWADEYWQRVAACREISTGFRRIARDNHAALQRLRQRFE